MPILLKVSDKYKNFFAKSSKHWPFLFFTKINRTSIPVDEFTQADVRNGRVVYHHSGENLKKHFLEINILREQYRGGIVELFLLCKFIFLQRKPCRLFYRKPAENNVHVGRRHKQISCPPNSFITIFLHSAKLKQLSPWLFFSSKQIFVKPALYRT